MNPSATADIVAERVAFASSSSSLRVTSQVRPTAISRHINDSLAILPAMDNAVGMMTTMQPALPHPPRIRIVDVGSGGY